MTVRHAYQCWGNPCSRSTTGPASEPVSATWTRAPRTVTKRCRTPGTCGMAATVIGTTSDIVRSMTSFRDDAELVKRLTNSASGRERPLGDLMREAHRALVVHLELALRAAGDDDVGASPPPGLAPAA